MVKSKGRWPGTDQRPDMRNGTNYTHRQQKWGGGNRWRRSQPLLLVYQIPHTTIILKHSDRLVYLQVVAQPLPSFLAASC